MEFVGINPKQYHRIVRFNNLLPNIHRKKNICHWTDLAYQFGYYDQVHFIKDFKTFYGKTPSAFSGNKAG
jgi:AraC-like DNA-binding protein